MAFSWRWTEYSLAIWTCITLTVSTLCLPESYAPKLLAAKANNLRKTTGDRRYYHPHEDQVIDLHSIVTKHFARPVMMLATEPMVTVIALYASFVYGTLYMTLEIFPIVFHEHRGWKLVVSTLPFLALFVGVLCAFFINVANQPRYKRISDAAGGKSVPEARLLPMAVGGILFTIGLWIFAWTADSPIHWIAPNIGAAIFAAGFSVTFNQCVNFLVDTYSTYAASAVAANTILRSIMAAGLPLAARPMLKALGTGPAISVLGALATIAIPVPFLFMKYTAALRRQSKYA